MTRQVFLEYLDELRNWDHQQNAAHDHWSEFFITLAEGKYGRDRYDFKRRYLWCWKIKTPVRDCQEESRRRIYNHYSHCNMSG